MGEDVKTMSKLHLVDLSGSERPSQTGIDGKTLEEAKNINLSLHIPYRNSMMTMVLRDSLGGNCKTKMIATVSAEAEDVYESLSTCRFAKRVSKIQNLVSRNEQADPSVIIARLKREVAELKAELLLLKGGEGVKESLTAEDIDRCNKMVEDFLESNDPMKQMGIVSDRLMIN
jgi:kinesin family member 6/9